ncbi:unnamed protein product [Merluccius merluccius]
MFSAIARMLFGGEEKTAEDALSSGEVVDEGWLLLNHKEGVSEVHSGEDQGSVEVHGTVSTPTVSGDSDPNLGDDSRPSEPEVPVDHSTLTAGVLRDIASRDAALAKVTHAARIQRAQSWAERHQVARSNIKRQNCVRERSQSHRSHLLQQPGRCNHTH